MLYAAFFPLFDVLFFVGFPKKLTIHWPQTAAAGRPRHRLRRRPPAVHHHNQVHQVRVGQRRRRQLQEWRQAVFAWMFLWLFSRRRRQMQPAGAR